LDSRKLSSEEVVDLARMGLEDPIFFYRNYFPEWFSLPMPWFHRGVAALLSRQTDFLLKFGPETWPRGEGVWDEQQLDKILRHFVWKSEPDDPTSPMVPLFTAERDSHGKIQAVHMSVTDRMLVIAPRGISKTTLVNAENIRQIVNQLTDFLVYLSETGPHSEQQLDNVKREFESNEQLLAVYGNKKPGRSDPEHWSGKLIETTDGVVIAARGRGGQVRGLNHRGKRPSKIIFDDVEDKESVATDAQRDKARTWLKADVEQALPQISGRQLGQIIGLGTIIHHDSLLLNLARDPEWMTVRFGAVDPDGDMLWNHYMTQGEYQRKKQSFMRMGKLADFHMEFQSSTKSEGDNAKFKPEYIRYETLTREDFVGVALAVDPAIGQKKRLDYCAFGVCGITDKGRLHVLDVHMEVGMSPRQQIDKYFELNAKWDCNKHGVESIAYQKALVHLLREEMFRKAKVLGPRAYHEIEPIPGQEGGKKPRVEGILSPRYASGYVTHQRRFPILEEQLLDWPNAKMDGPDVIAMCLMLLDPYAALALEDEDDGLNRLSRDEYPPLDEVIGGNYRLCP